MFTHRLRHRKQGKWTRMPEMKNRGFNKQKKKKKKETWKVGKATAV